MPFAAVLTRASCCFYLRVSRFSARKGVSGSGLCPLTILRHIANLQAPYALRQGIPSRSSNGQQARCLCFLLALRTEDSLTRLGQRLRLLRASANSGDASSADAGWPLHDPTSHEKPDTYSWTFSGRSSFPTHVTSTTRPRERHAAFAAGFCQRRFAELRYRANPSGKKASFAGSPIDRRAILDRLRHRRAGGRTRAYRRHGQAPLP